MIFDVDDVYEIEESYKIKLENKDKEIERLKGVYGKNLELVDKMYVKDKEIERLNNIINELEKDINKRIERYDVDETINGIVTGTLKYVLNKLQELKGADKK